MTGSIPTLNQTVENLNALKDDVDTFFLAIFGAVVFFMHCGFAFLESGSIRPKNLTNTVLKNLMDISIGALFYWALGFGFAFGGGNRFIGNSNFFCNSGSSHQLAYFFFEFTFAAACTSIISGAMAERTTLQGHLVYSALVTGFLYPVVSHWAWSSKGWLNEGVPNKVTFLDFAGSGVVHVTGGTVALVGAIVLGPRVGRFDDRGRANDLGGNNVSNIALGTFILLFGFLAFNGGSALTLSKRGGGVEVARSIFNTVLSVASSATSTLFVSRLTGREKKWSFLETANGSLVGAVAICAGCNILPAWAAVVVGAFAGIVYLGWTWVILRFQIDDPLNAVAVHFGGGMWGLVAVALFNKETGVFLNRFSKTSAMQLGWNIMGGVIIMGWTTVISVIMFGALQGFGWLRVSEADEELGLDVTLHREPAYPWASISQPTTNSARLVKDRSQYDDPNGATSSLNGDIELQSPSTSTDKAATLGQGNGVHKETTPLVK